MLQGNKACVRRAPYSVRHGRQPRRGEGGEGGVTVIRAETQNHWRYHKTVVLNSGEVSSVAPG